MNDIARAGVIMIVYLFLITVMYIFISSPFDDFMTSFENLNNTASDSQVESSTGYGRTVFDIIFGGLAIVPVLYFIVWVFKREPDWGYR